MFGEYHNIKIAGIQAAAPAYFVNNEDLAERIGSRRARKFIEYTGVKRRHLMERNQSAADLSAYAADCLLKNLNWDRNEIRVLVNVTQSPDLDAPSMAMIIQKRLGIGINCIAFDVNLGCSAYPSGLQIVSALLQNTGGKGLLLVGDGNYYEMPEKPSIDSLLFGGGAAATAIELEPGHDLYYSQYTDGSRFHLLYGPRNRDAVMDGNAIMLFSLNEVCGSIVEFKNQFRIMEDDIDYYVFHQAQKLIIDGMLDELKINPEKALRSYEEYGNTSAATLPITLCYNKNLFKKGNKLRILFSGFGVGLAWSAVWAEIEEKNIFSIINSKHKYMDLPM